MKACGIFVRSGIGASPDGLPSDDDWLLEIKTRSINCPEPLQTIEKYMLVQVLIQLYCTKRSYCILMSYQPESKTAHYFIVHYDHDLVQVILTCLKAITAKRALTESDRWDCSHKLYADLWDINVDNIPCFSTLAGLRRVLHEKVKLLKPVTNVRDIFDK